jgi:hypothetical protein
MRINIPQIVEKSSKRRAQFLAKFLRNQILNNYCGLRQRRVAARLTAHATDEPDSPAFNPPH